MPKETSCGWKGIIALFVIISIIKGILACFISSPTMFSDEYVYVKLARSIFFSFGFSIHEAVTNVMPPLYPLLLSVAYFFDNMKIAYFVMKVINSFASSAIIFPAYFLAKEFLAPRRAFQVTLLISVIPITFAFAPYLLAENLFYTLFMFTFFFVYKSFKDEGISWDLLGGLFLGLCFLTRTLAMAIIPAVAILMVIKSYLDSKFIFHLKKKLILFFIAFIVVAPWLIRGVYYYGFTLQGLIGQYALQAGGYLKDNYWTSFPVWFAAYFVELALASGFVLFLMCFFVLRSKDKNARFFLLCSFVFTFFVVLMATNHSSQSSIRAYFPWMAGRLIGRYVDGVLPLIFILGFIGLGIYEKLKGKYTIWCLSLLSLPFMMVGSLIAFSSLFPVNNISLAYLGFFKSLFYELAGLKAIPSWPILIFIAVVLILIPVTFAVFDKFGWISSKIIFPMIVFFLLLSLLDFSVNYYNSNYLWAENSHLKLGRWFNDYDNSFSVVLFDNRDEGLITKDVQEGLYNGAFSLAGFWMNDKIIIGDVNTIKADYIVSMHSINLPVVYADKEKSLFVYKGSLS